MKSTAGSIDKAHELSICARVLRVLAFREVAIAGLVMLLAGVLTVTTQYFATIGNIRALAINIAPEALIAVTMTYLIISGGFDLSVGSVMGLAGVVVAWLLVHGQPIPVAVCAGAAAGALIGTANGLMVTRIRVNALIATLASMWLARGLALALTQGYPLANLPDAFGNFGRNYVLGMIPVPVLVMFIVVIAGDFAARRMRIGRLVYYVGGNEKAARYSGIRVDRIRLACYALSGLAAAVAGITLTSRLLSATPTAGVGVELRAICAVVIGGASLSGGEGTVLGTFLGMMFMALVGNALTMLDVSLYWHQVVTGGILALAVSTDTIIRRRQRAS